MLPHLADRPLTMIRFPDGISKHQFFQKHWEHKLPEFVETITVYSGSKQENGEYLLGNTFPIADLNAASVLSWAAMMRLDMSATPKAAAWLQKCLGREANAKVRAMK